MKTVRINKIQKNILACLKTNIKNNISFNIGKENTQTQYFSSNGDRYFFAFISKRFILNISVKGNIFIQIIKIIKPMNTHYKNMYLLKSLSTNIWIH